MIVPEVSKNMGSFTVNKLGDIASIQTGPFGSQLHQEDYVIDGTPIITVEHLGDNRLIHENLPCVSQEDKSRLSKYLLEEGDIVFSRVGSVDRRAYVKAEEGGWLFSGRCLRVRVKRDIVCPKYLSYYFGLPSFITYIRQIAVGATMPSLNTKIMSELDIPLPPLVIQEKIAAVLSSLDDKIEINARMNKVLEEIAQALFKRWFVDFEFPDGEGKPYKSVGGRMVESEMGMIPEGWEVGCIGDVVLIAGGSTPDTKNENYWTNGTNAFCTPKDLSLLGSPILIDTERHITDEGVQSISSKQLPPGVLLLSSRAPIGYIAISAIPVSINQGFIAMICDEQISNVFVMQWLKENMVIIKGRANGSTFMEISKRNFRTIPFIIPPTKILDKYNNISKLIFENISFMTNETRNINKMRDALLVNLMNKDIMI